MSPKKSLAPSILITGAAGFIGGRLAMHFNSLGYRVFGIDKISISRADIKSMGFENFLCADVTLDTLALFGQTFDAAILCAGFGTVNAAEKDPFAGIAECVRPTQHSLEFLKRVSPLTNCIFFSSAAVYGNVKQNGMSIEESASVKPVSLYGVGKQQCEALCQYYADQFGLNIVVARPFSVYGEGLAKQLLWDASRKLLVSELAFAGTGEEVRDFIHIDDVCLLSKKVLVNFDRKRDLINFGSGSPTKIYDVICELDFLLTGNRRDLAFSGKASAGSPNSLVANIENAKAFQWSPTISISTGLKRYASWFAKKEGRNAA